LTSAANAPATIINVLTGDVIPITVINAVDVDPPGLSTGRSGGGWGYRADLNTSRILTGRWRRCYDPAIERACARAGWMLRAAAFEQDRRRRDRG
jgi:hypothetical protein